MESSSRKDMSRKDKKYITLNFFVFSLFQCTAILYGSFKYVQSHFFSFFIIFGCSFALKTLLQNMESSSHLNSLGSRIPYGFWRYRTWTSLPLTQITLLRNLSFSYSTKTQSRSLMLSGLIGKLTSLTDSAA